MPSSRHHAALAAAQRGWPVFPLRPGEKRPAFPDHDAAGCTGTDPRCHAAGTHQGWEQRATTDPDRITRAWTHTAWNIGIATGPAGLVVVDLDMPKHGETPPPEWQIQGVTTGEDAFAYLCEQAGQPLPLDTHTVTTPSGGLHLYYQHPADGPRLRNTTKTLAWLVDTRAWGGYVVGAESVVGRGIYTTVYDIDPAPLPNWLAQQLAPAPLPPQRPVVVELDTGRLSAYLRAAVDRTVADLRATQSGQRNRALYGAAVSLGQLVAGGALPEQEVTALLAQVAAEIGQGPGEAARTIRSGLKAGANRPRSVAA